MYANALERELVARKHHVMREFRIQLKYKGEAVGMCRLGMVVDETVIVETKSTRTLHQTAERQALDYLSASGLDIGFLFHFGPQPRFRRLIRSELIPGVRRPAAGS